MGSLLPLLSLLAVLGLGGAASAILIDSGDGTGNTSAPSPDPGWSHVGLRGSLTVVYLGSGAVLTANHVGAGDVVLGGVTYSLVPGSAVRLDNGDGSNADLLLFAIHPPPPLADLAIAATPPALGTPLVLIGNGRNRGNPTSWDPNGPPPPGPIEGYEWAAGRTLRWGTNSVEEYPEERIFGTESFATLFDESGSAHEGQAATGDSGGAAFAWTGSEYELAGLVFAIGLYEGQPAETSLYGQRTYAADLSFYRDQIETLIALPEPAGAHWAGAALLAALGAVRRRGRTRPPPTLCCARRPPAAERRSPGPEVREGAEAGWPRRPSTSS